MFKYEPSIRQKIIFTYYAGIVVIIGLSVLTLSELWYMEKKVRFGAVVTEIFDTTLEIRRFEKNFFLYEKEEDYGKISSTSRRPRKYSTKMQMITKN